MNYRPEIDGLRAVAVLAVLFYHAGAPGFTGGFVGVDIFFVISGYLITGILAEDLNAGRFSLKRFYERRVRRILPPLFLMIALVAPAAWVALLPADFHNFGRSAAAASSFWSNIFFWLGSGYFEAESFTKPLLHCWSLAVEEQFYLVLPLLLWLLFSRLRRGLRPVLAGLAAVSLAAAVFEVGNNQATAFYFLHTRAWELLAGSLVALTPLRRIAPGLAGPLAYLALGLMLMPVFRYSSETLFPGLAALPPVLGAALFIFVHREGFHLTLPGRVLAGLPLRGIGRISYSLYLWHWPLLALPRYIEHGTLSPAARLVLVAIAFLAAYASWRWAENPIRSGRVLKKQKSLFVAAGLAIAVFTAAGLLTPAEAKFYDRLSPQARRYAMAVDGNYEPSGPARPWALVSVEGREVALRAWSIGPQGEPVFLVWGDSHANMWRAAFDLLAEEYGRPGLYLEPDGCWPLRFGDKSRQDCGDFLTAVAETAARKNIRHIFLGAYYHWDLKSPALPEKPLDYQGEGQQAQRRLLAEFADMAGKTVAALSRSGAEIWIMENIPAFDFSVPHTLALEVEKGRSPDDFTYPVQFYHNRQAATRPVLEGLNSPGVRILRAEEQLCPDGRCRPADEGGSFYTDTHHLSNYGAIQNRAAVEPMFRAMGKAEDTRP